MPLSFYDLLWQSGITGWKSRIVIYSFMMYSTVSGYGRAKTLNNTPRLAQVTKPA